MTKLCCYCGEAGDLRPYGPGGAPVCYWCATGTPERRAQILRAFLAQIDAAGAVSPASAVLVGGDEGPVPIVFDEELDE